ncbi:LuxR C-terminal-related transcriptional regulator [Spirillospora sp. NPDC047279]|uniref:LuxR C-terminal-related transcriptional regulator n=1 Tax=Spirillospora sp. NPDC047279 TaxID=3155478 RepID=UPI0033DE758A
MNSPAREAADQLVRLTRLVVRAGDPPAPWHEPGPGPEGRRILRHNQAELTEREQQVFGLIVSGGFNRHLAEILEISEEAVESHLRALLRDFELPQRIPVPPRRAAPRRRSHRRRTALLVTPAVMGGALLAFHLQPVAVRSKEIPRRPAVDALSPLAAFGVPLGLRRSGAFPSPRPTLPGGVATATSFWDPATARGARMSYDTLASPYWPLGTRVRVTYRDESVVGVVEDFGPADWAIAQHDVPAIIDLSEKMMADLTGTRSHAIRVRFEVLEWGRGEVYRASGPGYDLATGGGRPG